MKIEIWSDVVCPFCYLGKRHLSIALTQFAHSDEVEVQWRSFQLDPKAVPGDPGGTAAGLAAKYGMDLAEAEANQQRLREAGAAIGIDFAWDRVRSDATFDAHRFVQYVAAERSDLVDEVVERLFRIHFTDGGLVSDHATLVELAIAVGLDGEAVRTWLASDAGADRVHGDLDQARQYGISGVPFFVIDEAYGVSGAQPPEVLRAALDEAWEARAGNEPVAG